MDRKGDLGDSWEAAPRTVFVWEGLLAHLSPDKEGVEGRWIKLHRWQQAFKLWEWDVTMRHVIHDINWRMHWMTDVLVTHPKPFADLVRSYMDETSYEYVNLYNCSLEEFDRRLPYMPEISGVYHGDSRRPFLFGSRGRVYQNHGQVTSG